MIRTATLSADGAYRFRLDRDWRHENAGLFGGEGLDQAPRIVVWVMANPSTADHAVDDPTIRRIVRFSRAWGFDALRVVNLSPFRSSTPAEAHEHVLPGEVYLRNLGQVVDSTWGAERVVAAWGNVGAPLMTGALRTQILHASPVCLGTTAAGNPKHPLARGAHRVPDDFEPLPWGPQ